MCPVTCDHALSIEVLSLSLLYSPVDAQVFVTQSFLGDEPLRTSACGRPHAFPSLLKKK